MARGGTLFLCGKGNTTQVERVETLHYLGGGVCTTAWEVADNRYTGGTCVYAFTYKIDYPKEALANLHHRNPHLPTIRRVGVGYYNGDWGVIYRMPKYTTFGNADSVDSKLRTTYARIDGMNYRRGDLKAYEAEVKRNKKIPASVRHALCILGRGVCNEQVRHGELPGLYLDAHDGNAALDEDGNLILLDIFNVTGGTYSTHATPDVKKYDKVGLDVSNWKKWLEVIQNV